MCSEDKYQVTGLLYVTDVDRSHTFTWSLKRNTYFPSLDLYRPPVESTVGVQGEGVVEGSFFIKGGQR